MLEYLIATVVLAIIAFVSGAAAYLLQDSLNWIHLRDGKRLRDRVAMRLVLMALIFGGVGSYAVYTFVPFADVYSGIATFLAGTIGAVVGRRRANRSLIYFYRVSDAFGEWSNFAEYPIVDGEVVWPTSEHKFQAAKFATTDPAHAAAIQAAKTGKEAARLGRDRSHPMRADWEKPFTSFDPVEDANLQADWNAIVGPPGIHWRGRSIVVREPISVKDYEMLKAVRLKVRQHAVLRTRLLDSDDAIFIEHTENDAYWADGGDGYGRNMLGKIIMIVRIEEQRRQRKFFVAS